jgi:hypothetical protein
MFLGQKKTIASFQIYFASGSRAVTFVRRSSAYRTRLRLRILTPRRFLHTVFHSHELKRSQKQGLDGYS